MQEILLVMSAHRLLIPLFISIFLGTTCSTNAACRELVHAQVSHVVCSFETAKTDIRLFLKNSEGTHYGRAFFLKRSLKQQPLMLMNGGMYHTNLEPVGLYVERGKQMQKLSTKGGTGNFHLLPNGVFWIKGSTAGVTETREFAKRNIASDHATQSGPMLVINGALHPRFLKESNSLKIRNGVGISRDGKTIHFAISRDAINFWNFGKLFQEELKAYNALFLDGTVSAIEADGFSQSSWRPIGPIIGVFAKGG